MWLRRGLLVSRTRLTRFPHISKFVSVGFFPPLNRSRWDCNFSGGSATNARTAGSRLNYSQVSGHPASRNGTEVTGRVRQGDRVRSPMTDDNSNTWSSCTSLLCPAFLQSCLTMDAFVLFFLFDGTVYVTSPNSNILLDPYLPINGCIISAFFSVVFSESCLVFINA